MKKAMIALSAILVAAPVFAATTHATDDTVAAANANANTAKEKLHQAQHEGEEQQLKAKHAAEGKQDKRWQPGERRRAENLEQDQRRHREGVG